MIQGAVIKTPLETAASPFFIFIRVGADTSTRAAQPQSHCRRRLRAVIGIVIFAMK
jgi:hypothetical protein